MNKISGLACCLLLVFLDCGAATGAPLPDPFPRVAKSYLLIMDGKPLWAHRPDMKLPPASLTKIMTAYIALNELPLDEIVTVSREASRETGTRLGLRQGETMYAGFLLAATLLNSANDACRALADRIGGDQDRFAGIMNAEARTLGMRHTRFRNACGHDQPGHYSTAEDLFILTDSTLKVEGFAEVVAKVTATVTTINSGRSFTLLNKNELVGRYPGAVGVKTGYTGKAGKCLIALARRGGNQVLMILLNAKNRWWDATEILDKAFAQTPQTRTAEGRP